MSRVCARCDELSAAGEGSTTASLRALEERGLLLRLSANCMCKRACARACLSLSESVCAGVYLLLFEHEKHVAGEVVGSRWRLPELPGAGDAAQEPAIRVHELRCSLTLPLLHSRAALTPRMHFALDQPAPGSTSVSAHRSTCTYLDLSLLPYDAAEAITRRRDAAPLRRWAHRTLLNLQHPAGRCGQEIGRRRV